jgi:hypothetical protein
MAMESPKRSTVLAPGSAANRPRPAAMAAAPISASTVKSETWATSFFQIGSGGSSGRRLRPRRVSRSRASAAVSPRSMSPCQ